MPCTCKALISALSRAGIAAIVAQRAAYAGDCVILGVEEPRSNESADQADRVKMKFAAARESTFGTKRT